MLFRSVDQASPIAANAGYTQATGTTASQNIGTVAANAWVVDMQYAGADEAVTPTSGQTQRINDAIAVGRTNDRAVMTTRGPVASPSSITMSYSYSESSQVALSMLVLRPAP